VPPNGCLLHARACRFTLLCGVCGARRAGACVCVCGPDAVQPRVVTVAMDHRNTPKECLRANDTLWRPAGRRRQGGEGVVQRVKSTARAGYTCGEGPR
jgi:hypothetical protein